MYPQQSKNILNKNHKIDITDPKKFPKNPKGCENLDHKEIDRFLNNKGKGNPPSFLTDPNSPIYEGGNFVTNFNDNDWNGKTCIGVKVGNLLTIYRSTGLNSYADVLCYEIDKETKKVKQVSTPVLDKYPNVPLDAFMPWSANVFGQDDEMRILKGKKVISSDEAAQRDK